MFLLTLEFWFWTVVIVAGIGLLLRLVASDAFGNFLAVTILLALAAAALWVGAWVVQSTTWADLKTAAGVIAAIVGVAVFLMVSSSVGKARSQKKNDRQALLDAVTRRRVFEMKGLDDNGNKLGATTDHGFTDQQIAENAKRKWGVTLPGG